KESVSSSCTASRSASEAGAITTSSTFQLLFRLGEADVDRRDVRVRLEPPRRRDGARATRARSRRVPAAEELRDGQPARRLRQMRSHHLPPVLEFGYV